MDKNFEMLKGLFGDQVAKLSEDESKFLAGKLDKLVETRVDAKVSFQTEVIEAEAKEKYDSLLKEATSKFETGLKTLEESLTEKATAYKEKLQGAFGDTKKQLTEEKEVTVEAFKKDVVVKLDKYLKLELDKKVPEVYVEAVAKVQVLEPIVEGFKKTMEENYIHFDEENFGLLKDARGEIIKLREEVADSVKENMDLNSDLQKHVRSAKISQVCEGLTDAQRERASTLLESYDVKEIDTRFSSIRDIIIEGTDSNDEEKDVEEECDVEDKEVDANEEEVKPVLPADKAVKVEANEEAEEEEVEEEKPLVTESADEEALNDDKRLIESWATEFKNL